MSIKPNYPGKNAELALAAMNAVSAASAGYRDLVEGDVIQEDDEWFNPDWEVGGPWFAVKPETGVIGQLYKSTCRPMRRKR